MGRVPLPSTLAILPEGKSQSKQTQKKSAIFMTPWAFSPEPSSSHALYDAVSKKETMRTYNALGNITQEILSSCQIIDDGRYEYDLDGNLIFDGEWHYTYDTQNRLITLENKNKRIECEYDSFHRRLSKKVFANGQVKHERYLWDRDNEIGVMNEQGQIEQLRILGEGLGAEIGAAVLYELKGKAYIPIHDHRGCVVTLIDMESKQPLESYRYTAFGEELTKNTLSPWRFASKRVDETGLIFFGRRYYHPELGRWISQDPQGFEDGPNLYAYLHNCPLTDFDLYGLFGFGSMWNNAQHFMWGMLEGSAYHFQHMASSFCMRDFSQPEWKPKSLMQNQNMVSSRGMDWVEKSVLPFTYEARRLDNDVSQNDRMRARGRAFGEQAITFGGLFSAFSAGKNLLNAGPRLQEMTTQGLSREYLFSGKPTINGVETPKASRNHFQPDARAEGAHSVFRRDPVTGKVSHYETYRPQTNRYDPKPWESFLRFDGYGSDPHLNKVFKEWIKTPHVHDPHCPGGIRPAEPWEMPR